MRDTQKYKLPLCILGTIAIGVGLAFIIVGINNEIDDISYQIEEKTRRFKYMTSYSPGDTLVLGDLTIQEFKLYETIQSLKVKLQNKRDSGKLRKAGYTILMIIATGVYYIIVDALMVGRRSKYETAKVSPLCIGPVDTPSAADGPPATDNSKPSVPDVQKLSPPRHTQIDIPNRLHSPISSSHIITNVNPLLAKNI